MIKKTTEEVKANVCKNRCLGAVTASGKGAWEAVGVSKDNGVGFPSGKTKVIKFIVAMMYNLTNV